MSEDRPDTEKATPEEQTAEEQTAEKQAPEEQAPPDAMSTDVVDRIRQLAALMEEMELAELEVEEPDLRLKLRTVAGTAPHMVSHMAGVVPQAGAEAEEEEEGHPEREEGLIEVTSPMVGTFYRAPSEGAEPYVTVGTIVEPETVVCIVEAMKVMNEVKAEISGEIVEILVQNGEPVEFGQVLFLAKPIEE